MEIVVETSISGSYMWDWILHESSTVSLERTESRVTRAAVWGLSYLHPLTWNCKGRRRGWNEVRGEGQVAKLEIQRGNLITSWNMKNLRTNNTARLAIRNCRVMLYNGTWQRSFLATTATTRSKARRLWWWRVYQEVTTREGGRRGVSEYAELKVGQTQPAPLPSLASWLSRRNESPGFFHQPESTFLPEWGKSVNTSRGEE